MPLRLKASEKPPRMTVSPSLPKTVRRHPLAALGRQAKPRFGATLFQSVLNALVPAVYCTNFGDVPVIVPGLNRFPMPDTPHTSATVAVE